VPKKEKKYLLIFFEISNNQVLRIKGDPSVKIGDPISRIEVVSPEKT